MVIKSPVTYRPGLSGLEIETTFGTLVSTTMSDVYERDLALDGAGRSKSALMIGCVLANLIPLKAEIGP